MSTPSRALSLRLVLATLVTTGAALPVSGQGLFDDTVLHVLRLDFEAPDWWSQMEDDKANENGEHVAARMTLNGVDFGRVGVRFRGRASFWWANEFKKPFKIKFDHYQPGLKVHGYDSIRLNNGWEDPSMCRDVLMGNALRSFGPMSGAGFTKLVLNGQNWGVYTTEETKDRGWMRTWYRDPDGNCYKSVDGGNLAYLGSDPRDYRALYQDKSDNGDNSYADLIHLCDVINNTPKDSLTDELRKVMDVDSTIWQIAGDCVFGNLDSYYSNRNNFYVITDPAHDTMELVNHDLGLSFGTWDQQGPFFEPTYKFDSSLIPLVKNMFRDRRLEKEYFAHIQTLIEESFNWNQLGATLTAYRDLIRDEVYRDKKKLFTNANFDDALDKDIRGIFFLIPALKPYIQNREGFLKNHDEINRPRTEFDFVGPTPAFPEPKQPITMYVNVVGSYSASKMELWWRTQGPFQKVDMFDDGKHHDGGRKDGLWAVELPGLPAATEVEYYVVSTESGRKALGYEPLRGARGAHRFWIQGATGTGLIVNEFLADNLNGLVDESGQPEDWIEIYNGDTVSRDLTGMYLTDDLTDPKGWEFPPGAILAPGQHLIVWADDDENDGPFHSDFKLAKTGEHIGLVDVDGATVLSSFVFGAQDTDVSGGRLFDDQTWAVTLREPTPNAANKPSCGVRHYSAFAASRNPLELRFEGVPDQGESVSIEIENGAPNAPSLLYMGVSPDYATTGPGVWLLNVPLSIHLPVRLDGNGEASLPTTLPNDGSLLGLDIYLQDLCIEAGGKLVLSNAIELRVCQ